MSLAKLGLVHSVAFRVTEDEWIALQKYAEQKGTTIPQAAKDAIFERAGLKTNTKGRRRYGQMKQAT